MRYTVITTIKLEFFRCQAATLEWVDNFELLEVACRQTSAELPHLAMKANHLRRC